MRVFLTGATGYIGSAVAARLAKAGHEVWGMTRSRDRIRALSDAGIRAVVGDLRTAGPWRDDARACEVLVHAAAEHGPGTVEADLAAAELLAAAAAKGRRVLYTSGVWVLGPRRDGPADEASPLAPPALVAWRPAHERRVLEAGGTVLRPGCVYGGARGLFGMMFASIEKERAVRLSGDGSNRWATVHLRDLAEAYRLAAERVDGGLYHLTDGAEVPVRKVAEAFLELAGGGRLIPLSGEEAAAAFGPLAEPLAMDQRVSSAKARHELGWEPKRQGPLPCAKELYKEWKGG